MDTGHVNGAPVPGLAPDSGRKRGRLLYTLHVDGEVFTVRSHDGGTDYHWISGHNKDYGFGSSVRAELVPQETHEQSIRNFLAMIDPDTGYIADD